MVTWNKDSIIEINADEKRMSDIEKNMEQMRETAEQDVAALDGHTQDKNNPHGVTYTQTGAAAAVHLHLPVTSTAGHLPVITQDGQFTDSGKGVDDFEAAGKADAVQAALDTHASSRENPHKVTKAQVGLGNCDDTSDWAKPLSNAAKKALSDLEREIPIYGKMLEEKDIWIKTNGRKSTLELHGICYENARYVAVGCIYDDGIYIATTTKFENDSWEFTKVSDSWKYIKCKICFANKFFWYLESDLSVSPHTGRVLRSTDGINWTETNAPYPLTLGICYGNGVYVAYPDNLEGVENLGDATIKTSTDGDLWTACEFDFRSGLLDVCYGNGVFVAVNNSYAFISEDGLNWEEVTDSYLFDGSMQNVTFTGGEFYITGCSYDTAIRSKDARDWRLFGLPVSTHQKTYSICKGNGMFFISGDIGVYVSDDLEHWEKKSDDDDFHNLLFVDGMLIGICWKALKYNKKTWLTKLGTRVNELETKMEKLEVPEIPENKFVIDFILDVPTAHSAPASSAAFGNGVAVVGLVNGQFVFSTDNGYTWNDTDEIAESMGSIDLLCFGNGVFVAVGSDKIYTSLNGKSWNAADFYTSCRNLCFVNGKFYACFPTALMSSADGVTWAEDTSHLTDCYSICYGAETYVAGTGSGIMTSHGGTAWTKSDAAFVANCICYGNGVFAALEKSSGSGSEKIYTSLDGKKWELVFTDPLFNVSTLSYGSGIFLGGPSDYAYISASTDGKTWTPVPSLEAASGRRVAPIENVCFTDGGFIGIRADNYITIGSYANETRILMGHIKQLAAYVGYKW